MLTPGINSQTFWLKDTSHVMNGTTFCVCSISAYSVLNAALKLWWRDHTTGGEYEERVVAKSKPERNLVTIKRTGSWTVPSSTASSSPVNFVPKDHEVRFKESAERSGAQNKETSRKVTKWKILKWGVKMKIRWPGRMYPWKWVRTKQWILKKVRWDL